MKRESLQWPRARRARIRAVLRVVVQGLACVLMPSVLPARVDAPDAWLEYARELTLAFEESLGKSDPTAAHFHAFLQEAALNAVDRPPPTDLIVKVWVDETGRVLRVEFSSLGGARADQELRFLLMRCTTSEKPPPQMRQPIRVRIVLGVRA